MNIIFVYLYRYWKTIIGRPINYEIYLIFISYFVFIFVGAKYEGKKFKKGVTCGVSIMRSGKSSFEMWQLAAHSLREHNYHYVHYSSLSLILPGYGKKLTFVRT